MKELKNVNVFGSIATITTKEHGVIRLNLDGACGEFTRDEWSEDIEDFSQDDQDRIMDTIDMHYNGQFFSTKEEDYIVKPQRGGKREGAGRKAGDRTEELKVRITPRAMQILESRTSNKSEYIDMLLQSLEQ